MTTEPATVGDLDPDGEVLKFRTSGTKVHLPGAENCHVLAREDFEAVRKRAAVLWDETPICPSCLNPDRGGRTGEWRAPVDPTEGSA